MEWGNNLSSELSYKHPACALILNNAKILSKSRIISVSGTIVGNLNDNNNVFREIRKTMIQHFFSKEWIEHQKLVHAYEMELEKNKKLQDAHDKLLEENKMLKSADNISAATNNVKSEEDN